jgi:hypothetical protein
MSAQPSTHLTEEALDDVLIGIGAPESEAHLASCSLCREKLTDFRTNVSAFNRASVAWSEAEAMKRPVAAPKAAGIWHIVSPFEWALAALLFLSVGIPVWNREHRGAVPENAESLAESADSEVQIAQDNALMKSVDSALSADDISPLRDYQMDVRIHTDARRKSKMRGR